jgi:type VI secretion system protein ImpA
MNLQQDFTFDVDQLLEPISSEAPAGAFLRYEGTYDRIQEARREDDSTLQQGVWKRDLKRANWNSVSEICIEALEKRSKDLQIAAWLLESWIQLYGFAGAREGLKVLLGLCQAFWDTMYPSLEDPEFRLAPLNWINEKLFLRLKFVSITDPDTRGTHVAYCFADWENAFQLEQHPELKKKAQKNVVTVEMIHQSATLTPGPFFQATRNDVGLACAVCNELEQIFDGALGRNSCSLSQFRGVLNNILSLISAWRGGADLQNEPEFEDGAHPEYALETVDQETSAMTLLPPIRSRAEAYRRLAEIADYLVRTEPHSPAPYLIRRAISWGGMTLEQLLPELVGNDAALGELTRLLKIETASKSK